MTTGHPVRPHEICTAVRPDCQAARRYLHGLQRALEAAGTAGMWDAYTVGTGSGYAVWLRLRPAWRGTAPRPVTRARLARR